ncbi:hypothetical protein GC101_01025 [Paenibacillus sp. LMG 31459]|uniref:Uncharacterized protein n=1 Tax=Paenibacillus phytohabitans TaxID=2654978 RepID=A0ABX1YAL2_9BACL|nr:hypothetical protein [Paenibacillus phytohabitans]NOU77454.1 hypothetical protein [Paenibacillus phytohabitans]
MLDTFIKQTRGLILRSDIKIHTPQIMPVEIREDGGRTHFLSFNDNLFKSAVLSENFMLNIFMFFGMLDAYVDSKYPELLGKTYADKLRHMPNMSDSESVLHEVFRIYKLIRNATIHNVGSIIIDQNGDISIEYNFRTTEYKLEISAKGLELLNSITYEFIAPFEPKSATYSAALRIGLLHDLRAEIKIFNDENNGLGPEVNGKYCLNKLRRYRPQPVRFFLEKNTLTIQNPCPVAPIEESYTGVDYGIELNHCLFLIPSEVLSNNSISLNQLIDWELN